MSILIPKAPKGGGRVDIYIIRRNCTLWFWRYKNLANSTTSQEQSNKERLMRCIIYSHHWLRTILLFVVKSAFYILTLAWGFRRCISVVHWKTIFLICYLLDYQQVQESSNVSIILLGDKKEPTKWKTNLVQQILLPNNHFPCYFYFKNHFYWRKEKKMCYLSMAANQSQYTNINSFILGYIY